jgi:DNA topoisomerase-1
MMLAQKLYEGLDIGEEGPVGLITYMRTDSTRLSIDAVREARKYISGNFGSKYLPHTPRVYSRKTSSTQDAHEAIRPTSVFRTPEKLKKYLHPDLLRLYELIWKRFIACQMNPSVSDLLTLLIKSEGNISDGLSDNEYIFRTTATTLKFDGFLTIYRDSSENGLEDTEEEHAIPEDIEVGDPVILENTQKNQHFTQPLPRFTESSLIKQLDALGIGRPSTYAIIVSTIINRTYVNLLDRKLYATELGETVNKLLTSYFPDIFNVKFTAQMEEEFDKIADGKMSYRNVLDDFYMPFNKDLHSINEKIKDIKQALQEKTDIDCDLCGHKMIIKWGRNGRFLSCSNYPKCKNAKPLPGEQEEHEEIAEGKFCSVCGAQMVVKTSRFGMFLGCSRYPECKNIQPITLGIVCPKCKQGEIVERTTQKRKKKFWGCTRYPDCDFISNFKPVDKKCEFCGFTYLLEKSNKKSGIFLECPNCKHKEQIKDINDEITTLGKNTLSNGVQ